MCIVSVICWQVVLYIIIGMSWSNLVKSIGCRTEGRYWWLQYMITVVVTICGATVFSIIVKKGIEIVGKIICRKWR